MGAIKSICSVCDDKTQPQIFDQPLLPTIPIKPIQPKLNFNDFIIHGILGQGGFGVVFLCQLRKNIEKRITQKYAMKRVPKKKLITKKVSENTKLQKDILATFSSKFIVALISSFQDAQYVYFVMEYAAGGDTYSLIRSGSPKLKQYRGLGEKAIRFIAGCVILGLEYLHKKKIMYRDLKPQNVLMFENGYVKLTDFGLAKKVQTQQQNKTISGTPFYYAPQMILKTGYNLGIDFWTLGIYLYQLSFLQPPFTTQQITFQKFKKVCQDAQNNRNWKRNDISQQLKDLIHGLLRFDVKVRLGCGGWHEVKEHQFFKDFHWKALEQQSIQSPIKDLVGKYPTKLRPFKPDIVMQTQYQNMEGWTYVRMNEIESYSYQYC